MADSERDKTKAAYGKVIARAWRDPAFKAKRPADPQGALKEAGVAVAGAVPDAEVKAVGNTNKHTSITFCRRPSRRAGLSDAA